MATPFPPTLLQAKSYLRVETSADDALIADLMAEATAMIETHLGRVIDGTGAGASRSFGGVRQPMPTVTSFRRGTAGQPSTEYGRVDLPVQLPLVAPFQSGLQPPFNTPVVAPESVVTGLGPVSSEGDWAVRIAFVMRRAVLDMTADLYTRRNPGASAENAGGGVGTAYTPDGIPRRIAQTLKPFRSPNANN